MSNREENTRAVLEEVALYFGCTVQAMRDNQTREQPYAHARQAAAVLLIEFAGATMRGIARAIGNSAHPPVVAALKKHRASKFPLRHYQAVSEIRERLKQKGYVPQMVDEDGWNWIQLADTVASAMKDIAQGDVASDRKARNKITSAEKLATRLLSTQLTGTQQHALKLLREFAANLRGCLGG